MSSRMRLTSDRAALVARASFRAFVMGCAKKIPMPPPKPAVPCFSVGLASMNVSQQRRHYTLLGVATVLQ